MSGDQQVDSPPQPEVSTSDDRFSKTDWVLIAVLIVAIIGLPFLWGIEVLFFEKSFVPYPFYAFVIASAVSALVHRFLGGIGEAKANIGGVQLGGSIAALVGTMILLLGPLKESDTDRARFRAASISPDVKDWDKWIILNRNTGEPIDTIVYNGDSFISPGLSGSLGLEKEDERYQIRLKNRPVGEIAVDTLREQELYRSLNFLEHVNTGRIRIGNRKVLSLVDITIEPYSLDSNNVVFTRLSIDGVECEEIKLVNRGGGDVYRGGEIVECADRYVVVSVSGVGRYRADGYVDDGYWASYSLSILQPD